jgi:hypothetical protein
VYGHSTSLKRGSNASLGQGATHNMGNEDVSERIYFDSEKREKNVAGVVPVCLTKVNIGLVAMISQLSTPILLGGKDQLLKV